MAGTTRFTRRGVTKCAGALVVLCLLAPAPTAAGSEGGWSDPVDLSPARFYGHAKLVPDEGGGFVHTWNETNENDWPVFARTIPSVGPPGPVVPLGGHTFYGADAAGDGRGNVVVAWDQRHESCCYRLAASVKDPQGDFSEVKALDYGGGDVGYVRVAMNDLGDAVIVYTARPLGAETREVRAIFRPSGEGFSQPVQVSGLNELGSYDDLRIDLSDNGEALVSYSSRTDTGNTNVRAAIGTKAGFGPPQILSDPGTGGYTHGLAIDEQGGAAVAFQYPSSLPGDYYPAAISMRKPGGSFEKPFPLENYVGSTFVHVGVDDEGRGFVGLSPENGQMVIRPFDTRTAQVGAPTTLGISTAPQLEVADDGRAIVAFDSALGFSSPDGTLVPGPVHAAWGNTQTGFGPIRAVSCAGSDLRLSEVSISDADGALLLTDQGPNKPDDVDDRHLITRSDPSRAPLPRECPVNPEISVRVPRHQHADEYGRFRVLATTSTSGQVSIDGSVRMGGERYRLIKTHLGSTSPGVTELLVEPFKPLELKSRTVGRVRIFGRIRVGNEAARDTASARIRFDNLSP